ncbi:hypothetical protein, partial [Zoogloea sp.]|uniref:hypothetical protein n=1 Tax=Zoogloea sp. TaxID=49181 RepID=UPI0035B2C35C
SLRGVPVPVRARGALGRPEWQLEPGAVPPAPLRPVAVPAPAAPRPPVAKPAPRPAAPAPAAAAPAPRPTPAPEPAE